MRVPVKVTYTDLESLPEDGKRYEIYEGEVFVTAAPRIDHQRLSGNVFRALEDHVKPRKLGTVLLAVDVYFTEETVFNPDLVFVAAPHAGRIEEKFIRRAPDLVIEIISPSTESRDRGVKLQAYSRYGVPEYWVFNTFRTTAEVYGLRAGKYKLLAQYGERDVLKSRVLPDLELPLEQIWPRTKS